MFFSYMAFVNMWKNVHELDLINETFGSYI